MMSSDLTSAPPWHSRPIVRIVFCALVVGVAFLATAIVEWVDRARTLATAHRIAATQVQLLAEQTAHAFQAVDLTLAGMADAIRVAPSLADHDRVFEEALRRKRDALPHVRALFVIGADGYIKQDTDHPDTPRVTLADRSYFQAHARDAQLGLHIERPLVSRSVNRWFVSVSRRIDARDGRFAGIAVAAVEPQYFGGLYDTLRLTDRDSIALLLADGTLLARNPHDDAVIGKSYIGEPLFQTDTAARSGTYETTSPVDRVGRVVSYRRLKDLPLVVLVGLDKNALLAPWRMRAVSAFVAAAVISLLVCFLGIVVSRHARQRAEGRRRLAEAERLEALGRLAGGIAHDFGNVLSTVVFSLKAARRTAKDDEMSRLLDRAFRAASRGTQLASQLLGFARRQELNIEVVSVNELVSDLEELLRDAASDAADITFDLAPDVWFCRIDRAQFGIALVNLVVNARQALLARRGRIRVATLNVQVKEARSEAELAAGEYVRLTVEDDGVGMPPDVLRRVTDPFFTTKPDGTGLGVSQVYGFVKQVGGDLRVESVPGAGTSVHLIFPRAPAATAASATQHLRPGMPQVSTEPRTA
jgi:signal transduction histidine kinase